MVQVVAVHDRCQALVAVGVPASLLEETDFGELVRAGAETGPDAAAEITRRAAAVLAALPSPP